MKFKTQYLFFPVLILTMVCCGNGSGSNPDIPDAFENKISYGGGSYSREKPNMVDELFREAIKTDKRLREIDEQIGEMDDLIEIGIDDYNDYRNNLMEYIDDADSYIGYIGDSSLSALAQKRLNDFNRRFDAKITAHEESVKRQAELEKQIYAYFKLLKLGVSLEMTQEYANEQIPNKSAIDGTNKQLEELLKALKEKEKALHQRES